LIKEVYVFDTIDLLPSDYWGYSFINKKVTINWANIKVYVNELGYDNCISELIFKNPCILKKVPYNGNKKLTSNIINDQAINLDILEKLGTIINKGYYNATDLISVTCDLIKLIFLLEIIL